MIMAYITPDHRTWGDDLDEKTWCYNTNIHETIGYSPFYHCNGRIPVSTPSLKRSCKRKAAEEWEKKLRNLELIRQFAQDNHREATEVQACLYNARRSPHKFQIGDTVLVKNTVLSNAADHTAAGLPTQHNPVNLEL